MRVLDVVLPLEPGERSVVVDGRGLAFQRHDDPMRLPGEVFPARWWPAAPPSRFDAVSWPMLCGYSPVVLVHDPEAEAADGDEAASEAEDGPSRVGTYEERRALRAQLAARRNAEALR